MALLNFGDFDDMFGRVDRMMNSVMRSMMGTMPGPFDHMISDMNTMSNTVSTMRPYGIQSFSGPSSVQSYSYSSSPHSYSHYSSSVMSLTNDEYGRPQVYEATQSSRCAPGGLKETSSTVRDSRSGLQQMSVGRHINERAHIIERSRNYYTRQEEENEEYVNIEEEDEPRFNNEWQRRVSGHRPAIEVYDDEPQVPPVRSAPPMLALPPCEPTTQETSQAGRVRSEKGKKSRSKRDKRPYKKCSTDVRVD